MDRPQECGPRKQLLPHGQRFRAKSNDSHIAITVEAGAVASSERIDDGRAFDLALSPRNTARDTRRHVRPTAVSHDDTVSPYFWGDGLSIVSPYRSSLKPTGRPGVTSRSTISAAVIRIIFCAQAVQPMRHESRVGALQGRQIG